MIRLSCLVLLLLCTSPLLTPAAYSVSGPGSEFVQAVEFPYHQYPRHLWERELVWLKNIGIRTVAFSIVAPSPADPRADLAGFLKILRRLGLRAWVREMPGTMPADAAKQAAGALLPMLEVHGGPVAFVEGALGLDAPIPSGPVFRLSATDSGALERSRRLLAGARGSLIWQQVEDTLGPDLRRGVVSFSGDERPGASALRRDAALLKHWSRILPELRTQRNIKGKIPAVQLTSKRSNGPSAVSVSNTGAAELRGELRVFDPAVRRELIVPSITVPAGETLWLPVNLPLTSGGLCDECTAFAPPDRVVYATAELHSIEFENGILAFEFAAPAAGEIVVRLSSKPRGPLLAGGRPMDFDWDEKNLVARLPVPAGKGAMHHMRIGLAIAPPDSSAFFGSPTRLVLGRANTVSTSYSSEELATRSRLLAPPGYRLKPVTKSPLEIDYEVSVPPDATHGEFVPFALEADGVRLGRARLQVFRPASLRIRESAALRFGADVSLPLEYAVVSFDPRAGRNFSIVIRNNYPSIQNYVIEASGAGLTFSPARTEITVAAAAERDVS
ncbi:MAG: hypothetical protein ABIZ80_03440, partial [Bryobacteraceae bacterium]